uniref:WD repeat-containing protein 60 n=1 Tax=Chrysotila carterae TaxID=13221 RepID=A0A7S4B0Q3_CHRCT
MADDDEEYEDDDFEDYEDEFEEDEPELPPAPPPQPPQQTAAAQYPQSTGHGGEQNYASVRLKNGPSAERASKLLAGPLAAALPPGPPPAAPRPPAYAAVTPMPAKKHIIAPVDTAQRQLSELRRVRLQALRGVLQLRPVDIVLYDSPPVSEYELYQRSADWKLRSKLSQTHEDDVNEETQTEEIETEEQLCQAPEDLASQAKTSSLTASTSVRSADQLAASAKRLNRFLRSAAPVVEALCAENALEASGAGAGGGFEPTSSLPFSKRVAKLKLPAALGPRDAVATSFSADASAVLVAYSPSTPPQKKEGKKKDKEPLRRAMTSGLVAMWPMHATQRPAQLLRCVGSPTVCETCSGMPHVVVAGTAEGSVQLWNLSEAPTSHDSITLDAETYALRAPTYCSDAAAGGYHTTPIAAITTVSTDAGATETRAVTLASLDAAGTLIVWQVLESETAAVDGTDYGQAVGGRVRLVKSSAVPTNATRLRASRMPSHSSGYTPTHASSRPNGDGDELLPPRTTCFQFFPDDASRLIVGADSGHVLHVSRYDAARQQPPSFSAPAEAAAVTAVAFCATLHAFFLAGRADGSISLYADDDAAPLRSWQDFATSAIVHVSWGPVRPAVFWAFEANGMLHTFDLCDRTHEPLQSSQLQLPRADVGGASPPPCIALGARVSVRRSTPPTCLLSTNCAADGDGRAGGEVEVHLLDERIGSAQEGETEILSRFLSSL